MTDINEELVVMTNLQNIRFQRPWIDAEFSLYQKLCRNREALLDLQLQGINQAMKIVRKEAHDSRNSSTL